MSHGKLVYLAGCYTRHPVKWLPRAIATPLNVLYAWSIARRLWRKGYYVLCPMTNTAGMDGATDYETFLKGCFYEIDRCDVFAVLPNWYHSPGAKRELAHAIDRKMPIRYVGSSSDQGCKQLIHSLPPDTDLALIEV